MQPDDGAGPLRDSQPWPARPKPVTSVTACGAGRPWRSRKGGQVGRGVPVEPAHGRDGGRLVGLAGAGQHDPEPSGLDRTSRSPGRAPALLHTRSGWTRPCTARPKMGSSERMV